MLLLPPGVNASGSGSGQRVRFGVVTDVHKDIMHDADERLQTFVDKASKQKLDFIIQLGDFCRPYAENREFLDIFNGYRGTKYHVIGNHDTDGGFSRQQVVEFWGAVGRYYSFDLKGHHFIVLDGNNQNPSPGKATGYARYIAKDQIRWLENDLAATRLPCIAFSHQSLENEEAGIENQEEVRAVLEKANADAGSHKVLACFSGHHHTDYACQINGISYIQINSMSYSWLGEDYQTVLYGKEIDEKYPWIKYTAPYEKPLYAFVTLNDRKIEVEGVRSRFVGPAPDEMGFPEQPENSPVVPFISNRTIIIQ